MRLVVKLLDIKMDNPYVLKNILEKLPVSNLIYLSRDPPNKLFKTVIDELLVLINYASYIRDLDNRFSGFYNREIGTHYPATVNDIIGENTLNYSDIKQVAKISDIESFILHKNSVIFPNRALNIGTTRIIKKVWIDHDIRYICEDGGFSLDGRERIYDNKKAVDIYGSSSCSACILFDNGEYQEYNIGGFLVYSKQNVKYLSAGIHENETIVILLTEDGVYYSDKHTDGFVKIPSEYGVDDAIYVNINGPDIIFCFKDGKVIHRRLSHRICDYLRVDLTNSSEVAIVSKKLNVPDDLQGKVLIAKPAGDSVFAILHNRTGVKWISNTEIYQDIAIDNKLLDQL
jgi:hypothetical protein